MKNHSVAVRSVTIAAAAALSIGVSAPIMPANAQAGVVRTDGNVRVSDSTIDTSATGTLTIFKRANPENTHTATGEVDSTAEGTALEGAGFTLYRVTNADLTTNDGLAAAANLTVAEAQYDKNAPVGGAEKTTGPNGQAKWDDLPVGVYLLKETTTPEGYSPAADSLVFVPMTRQNATNGGTQWLYDITAYPKNTSQQEPQKTVTDSGQNVGDTVTYNIDTYAQTVREGQFRTFYRVEDTLDPALRLVENNPVIVTSNPDRAFEEGTDYNIRTAWVNAQGEEVEAGTEGARQRVRVNFTNTEGNGVNKIQNGDQISVQINAEVNSKPGEGDLFNQATQYQNNPNDSQAYEPDTDTPPEEGTPTNEVHTFYGDLEFTKVNSGHEGLEGAEFKVFGVKGSQTCDALDWKNPGDNAAEQTASGNDTWTSDADGKVTITGLHANNIANFNLAKDEDGNVTATETPNEWTSYCLVETESPAGYELLAKPVAFTITAANNDGVWSVTNGSVKVGNTDNEIVNLEDSTPKLPLTGGTGIGILAALGALIIAAGAYSAKRRSA
ncbi:SpaH/EbpB family LPXTG-anchored major pilin [Corynebacterium sp. Q4381]|uniref:SpaH/EbpB family LPXTG-anchored major pilin n=1 Tax=Corynebacterium sp. Marseille-Q4381 TaxID=3121597 RepID=UPI002FE60732